MKAHIFWISILFSLAGFLPFYALHSNTIVIVYLVLVSVAVISRVTHIRINKALRSLILISSIILVWNEYSGLRNVEAAAGLFALLSILKLWEINKSRDYFLYFLIFQLMMISQYLLLESLLLLLFMIVSATMMCAVFMDLQKNKSTSNAFMNPGKRKILWRLMITSIALATVLFFSFPRSSFTLFRTTSKNQTHPWTDYSEKLQPGSITKLQQSDNIIFRARFSASSPALPDMYWHGSTLGVTDGFNWFRRKSVIFDIHLPVNKLGFYDFEADMEDFGKGSLFLLSPVSDLKLLSLGQVSWRGLGDARMDPLTNQKTRWRSSSLFENKKKDDPVSLQSATQIPDEIKEYIRNLFPEYRNLSGQEILKKSNELFSKDFQYSLSPGEYEGTPFEQLKSFLEDRKIGVCEHFASAQAIILRSFDIPSIISVGFHGGDLNEIGDYWVIRGRDAHAWVHFYDEDNGWVRNDPTLFVAPSLISQGATEFNQQWYQDNQIEGRWLTNYRFVYFNDFFKFIDSTYYNLNLAFINFDQDRQEKIWEFLGLEQLSKKWHRWSTFFIAGFGLFLFWLFNQNRSKNPWSKINRYYDKFFKKLHKLDLNVDKTVAPLRLREILVENGADLSLVHFVDTYVDVKYNTNLTIPTKNQIHLLRKFLNKNIYKRG